MQSPNVLAAYGPSPTSANIRAEFERTGISVAALAYRISNRLDDAISERQVRRYRDGDSEVPWGRLCAIAEEFGRDPQWFYMDHSEETA